MKAYWRTRLAQILFLSVVGLVVPRLVASTVTFDCDPLQCQRSCGVNEGNCIGQGGTITQDCSGNCVNGSCDNSLTCKLPN